MRYSSALKVHCAGYLEKSKTKNNIQTHRTVVRLKRLGLRYTHTNTEQTGKLNLKIHFPCFVLTNAARSPIDHWCHLSLCLTHWAREDGWILNDFIFTNIKQQNLHSMPEINHSVLMIKTFAHHCFLPGRICIRVSTELNCGLLLLQSDSK